MYIFTVNNLLHNQVRYFSVLIANRLIISNFLRVDSVKNVIRGNLHEKVFLPKFQTYISNNRQPAGGDGARYIKFH